MRTQKFQKVFDRVVRMLGQDPLGEVPQDASRSILDHINERVETIHQAWDWPEWTITEERAFRQVYSNTTQYKIISDTDGQPDEVFYFGDVFVPGEEFGTNYGYYRVKSTAPGDPPVGTVPTNTAYWEAMEQPIDAYVAYDQAGQRHIGRVTGVYNSNPRTSGNGFGCGCAGLMFRPSEKGIDVRGSGNVTVFLTYLMALPYYTIIPYVVGKSYALDDTVFYPATGECYQALKTTTQLPTVTTDWLRIPFLEKWASYVVEGAFADCLQEFDQGGNGDAQVKLALAAAAENRANRALEARIDDLTAQGQVLKYGFCKKDCHGWQESVIYVMGPVMTLIGGGGAGMTIISVPYSATLNVSAAAAPSGGLLIVQVGTLTGNITLANPTSGSNRQRIEYAFTQDATGNRTLTLGSKFKIPSSSSLSSPINSSNSPEFTAPNAKSLLMVEYDLASDKWDLIAFIPGY